MEGSVHTVYRDGFWVNESEGGKRLSSSRAFKRDAVVDGRKIADSGGLGHVVHNLDHTIDERYGQLPGD
jgi:hypothetical protein